VHFLSPYLLHFPTLYLATSLPLQKDERALPGNADSSELFWFQPRPGYNKCSVSHRTPPRPLSLSHRRTSCSKGLISLSFGVKYERLQFLLTREDETQTKVALCHVNDSAKVGPEYSESTFIVNYDSFCYKSLLDAGKAFNKKNKEIICYGFHYVTSWKILD
jgi:hypothetical protein